jgi:hypothetical protein
VRPAGRRAGVAVGGRDCGGPFEEGVVWRGMMKRMSEAQILIVGGGGRGEMRLRSEWQGARSIEPHRGMSQREY